VTKAGGFIAIVFPNKDHILERYWSRLITRWTDFDSYDIPEQHLGDSFIADLSSTGISTVLFDWIDCYDTISHFPSWLPLRLAAYVATACLPRPPRRLRRWISTRAIVIATKPDGVAKCSEQTQAKIIS